MDDTKGTPSDESKGKGTPSDDSKGTPKAKGKLYTEAEIAKIKSDAASMSDGRKARVAEQERDAAKQDLATTQSRLDAIEKEQEESREAEAKDDPDATRALRREKVARAREQAADGKIRDLARREAQLVSDRAEVDKDRSVVSVAYVAAKYGLETELLESLGISDPDALEKVAEKIAAAKPTKGGEDGEGGEGGEGEGFEPDSGGGAGGGAEPLEALEKANEDFAAGKITAKQLQEISDKVK